MRHTPLLFCLALLGCTQFPELDAVRTPGVEAMPYPDLLPLEMLLSDPELRASPEMRTGLEGRAAALRARAARLRGPVVSDEIRTRMEAGVHWPY